MDMNGKNIDRLSASTRCDGPQRRTLGEMRPHIEIKNIETCPSVHLHEHQAGLMTQVSPYRDTVIFFGYRLTALAF